MKLAVVAVDTGSRGHWGRDWVRLLCGSLTRAGHDCIITRNQPEPDRLNVVVGGHLIGNDDHLRVFSDLRYVVVQTAHLLSPTMQEPAAAGAFQRWYLPLLRGASAVWEPEPVRLPVLEAVGAPALRLGVGYDPGMRFLPPKLEQDIDFAFYGTITRHRQAQLLPLMQRGHRLVVVGDEDPFFRNDILARAKVHLAPRQGDGTGRVPAIRIATVLANRGLVVVETGLDHHGLDECVVLASSAEWVATCEHTLARADRGKLAENAARRFEDRPMAPMLQPLLEAVA